MDEERETIGKAADALRETAITGGKAIDAGSGLAGFFYRVMGEPVELAAGTFITDPLKEYRKQRLHRLQQKTEAILSAGGVQETRYVPPKVAVALFEEASLEDDDDLHTLWAKLLATAMTDGEAEVERKYVSILADLTRADAEVFQAIYHAWTERRSEEKDVKAAPFRYCPSAPGAREHDPTAVGSLNRLGLIEPGKIDLGMKADHLPVTQVIQVGSGLSDVVVTPLGEAFCHAVGLEGDDDE